MTYDIQLQQQAAQPLAVVRRRASRQETSKVIPEACGTVWKVVKSQQIAGAGRHIAVYLDDVINLEVGVEVPGPVADYGEVLSSATPAGSVVTTTHLGPYGELHAAHAAIQAWGQANGVALAGPCWEVYGHWLDEWNSDPSQIRTDVYYLVA
jgi:effector-binding domain-containing protein